MISSGVNVIYKHVHLAHKVYLKKKSKLIAMKN